MATTTEIGTPAGPARLHVHRARASRALVVLGHGAGRGTDTADLLGLAEDLPGEGVAVVLVDQPWVLAGRRVASPPATLDTAWVPAVAAARRAAGASRVPLVVGGRSAGARVACRTSVEVGAAGVLLLAFPLLPPAARSDAAARAKALAARGTELGIPLDAGLPVVAAQGDRDAFGTAVDLEAAEPRLEVHAVAAADHSFAVPKGGPSPREALLAAALAAVRRAAGE